MRRVLLLPFHLYPDSPHCDRHNREHSSDVREVLPPAQQQQQRLQRLQRRVGATSSDGDDAHRRTAHDGTAHDGTAHGRTANDGASSGRSSTSSSTHPPARCCSRRTPAAILLSDEVEFSLFREEDVVAIMRRGACRRCGREDHEGDVIGDRETRVADKYLWIFHVTRESRSLLSRRSSC